MSSMIRVWDLPTRLFHWSLVALFIFMIVSGKSDDMIEWHFYAGYVLAGLVTFRVIWGFLGTRYARFSSFPLRPSVTVNYLKSTLRSQHTHHYGHNPAGSIMVVFLLLMLAVQLGTGMMMTDDIIWYGPFYSSVSEETAELAAMIHHQVQNLLLVMVGLHVLAIIVHRVKFKESLVSAMIHGKKPKVNEAAEREKLSWARFIISAGMGSGLSYYLFTLPI